MFSLLCVFTFAQTNSPYSRFGLGFLRSDVFSSNKSMGEIAAGYRSAVGLNVQNPASYSELSLTTFEGGANIDATTMTTKDSVYKGTYGTLNHIAVGIPLKRDRWGLSLGLLPFATTNYRFQLQNIDTFNEYNGKGSLYKLYLGSAYRIGDFSIGFNVGYLFGKQEYYKGYTFTDSLSALNVRNNTSMNVNGFLYNLGIQYKKRIIKHTEANRLKTDIFFTAGAYGNSGVAANAKVNALWERYFTSVSTGVDYPVDTPLQQAEVKGKIRMPSQFGIGFTVGNENWWIVGADFKFSQWSKFSSPVSYGSVGDSWRFSLGAGITPDYTGKFVKRISYKAGFYAGKSEVRVNNAPLSEYGGTFGFVLPFVFGRDRVNTNDFFQLFLMGDIGTRVPNSAAFIKETYYRFTIGLSFNSLWFQRRKFD